MSLDPKSAAADASEYPAMPEDGEEPNPDARGMATPPAARIRECSSVARRRPVFQAGSAPGVGGRP